MLSQLLYELTNMSIFEGRLFRVGAAALSAIIMVMIFMPLYIKFLHRIDATSDFDKTSEQKSPPIMGGLLLVIVSIISSLCFAHQNSYVISTLAILAAYAGVGALDDIAKIKNKRLVSMGKISPAEYQDKADGISSTLRLFLYFFFSFVVAVFAYKFIPELNGHLTVPFMKDADLYLPKWIFIPFMSFFIAATANGTNFTDGLDSLVSVPIMTAMTFIGLVAYISGNFIFSQYLHLTFLPGVDELFPIAGAIIGSLLAYLWFNSPPAQIYMGDAGSIGFGGAIGIMFIFIQAELFLPIICFIILIEALSVVMQISYFKMTRKRIFLCAPIHHHFQIKWKDQFKSKPLLNSKIVWRFHIVSIVMLILGLVIFFKAR
ncbi:MAG: phospho-N-acetylmuramoyl-pentapeptide-transferase [Fibrobacterales bacterium]